ncbi:MAG: GreA/GreB family elongation factor [Chlamydiales bacterium]|nr:GreA/GreB family elongation factor [Chlamydiales bacterium]
MGYLEEFQEQLEKNDFHKFFQLWEEYCTSDTVESREFIALLTSIKNSEMATTFGQYAETALPLWQTIQGDDKGAYNVLRLIVDLQTTNTQMLRDYTFQALENRYGQQPDFNKRLRYIGLRDVNSMQKATGFQGAISHYDLLSHLEKGNFVYHAGGWGTGEIVDVSLVREEVVIEFENVTGRKYLSFTTAFKALAPLANDHFAVRRFAHPDELEKLARENPTEVMRMLLGDLGPKTASEIKDELADLVIPEKDWTKWWQNARAKVKKDTFIETPANLREPFILRQASLSHEDLFHKQLSTKKDIREILQTTYNFVRDLPDMIKKQEVKQSLQDRLLGLLGEPEITPAQALQIHIFMENHFNYQVNGKSVADAVKEITNIDEIINDIEIIAFKKRALTAIRESRPDWEELFLNFLYSLQQNQLRDYILKELQSAAKPKLEKKLRELLIHPTTQPEVFVWYFQKVVSGEDVPFNDKHGQWEFLETFLILYSILEPKPEYRELIKKMYVILSGRRYLIVRNIIEGTSLEFIQEFLLLVSKCRTLSDHDKKILRSLVEVVHPSLSTKRKTKVEDQPIWTTEDGLRRTQERVQNLGTVEIVDNAREIEAARALGDLRENSEYKFALERRARLQTELKTLSDQLNRSRVVTPDDISPNEVGIGAKVDLSDSKGKTVTYTILGPWDADAEHHILSFQSKLAESMMGKKVGESFEFKEETFTISKIRSFLD